MEIDLATMISDLGGTVGSLVACFWYIKYLSDQHKEERILWMEKDSESDRALREIMTDSNRILGDLKSVLTEQTTLLKTVLRASEYNKGE